MLIYIQVNEMKVDDHLSKEQIQKFNYLSRAERDKKKTGCFSFRKIEELKGQLGGNNPYLINNLFTGLFTLLSN
jgi:hypothetical protein